MSLNNKTIFIFFYTQYFRGGCNPQEGFVAIFFIWLEWFVQYARL